MFHLCITFVCIRAPFYWQFKFQCIWNKIGIYQASPWESCLCKFSGHCRPGQSIHIVLNEFIYVGGVHAVSIKHIFHCMNLAILTSWYIILKSVNGFEIKFIFIKISNSLILFNINVVLDIIYKFLPEVVSYSSLLDNQMMECQVDNEMLY